MKFQNRFLRLGAALAIAGLVATQIPMRSSAVLAADDYPPDGGTGLFSFKGAGGVVAIGALGALVYSVVSEKGAAAAISTGATVVGGNAPAAGAKPIYDVTKDKSAQFSDIAKIIDNARQVEFYRQQGSNTVFWPTNAALAKALLPTEITALGQAANKDKAVSFLNGLTINGRYTIADLKGYAKSGAALTTLSGATITFTFDEKTSTLKANDIVVTQDDIAASNGWIHPAEGLIARGDK